MELHYPVSGDIDMSETPMSRTHQYRKVMKPLLERKRRARINKCLDELKDLMVYALQSEGESITKLEKADVLELTVRHLEKLKRQRRLQSNPSLATDRYNAGYTACANEVSRCLATVPGVDVNLGSQLMSHLGLKLKTLEQTSSAHTTPLSVAVPATEQQLQQQPQQLQQQLVVSGKEQPMTPSDGGYSSGRESLSPRSSIPASESPVNFVKSEVEERRRASTESVWRPF